MHWILLTALIAASPESTAAEIEAREAARVLAGQLETGSLLLSQGDCLAVRIFTQSSYTHVASVVVRNGQPFVYDSANGAGVRCRTLEHYLASQASAELHVMQPQRPFSKEQSTQYEVWLDGELGRPYAIRHHLTGQRADGLHCAEYATDALIACGMLRANEPARVSPASLVEGVLASKLYVQAATVVIKKSTPPLDESASWSSRVWTDTKDCTRGCYQKMCGWFCCS